MAEKEKGEEIIRVPLPKREEGEIFGIVDKMLGGGRMMVLCEDGVSRMARIPGKIRRRMWIKEGDVVIVKPWDFQPEKADVIYRYNITQVSYLMRNNMLPELLQNILGE